MRIKTRFLFLLGVLAASAAAPAFGACSPAAGDYDIQASRMDSALQQFAHVSGCFVEADLGTIGDRPSHPVRGHYTPANALIRLVRGSGLEVHVDNGTYAVNRADRQALAQRVDTLRQRVTSAREANALSADTAESLTRQLDAAQQDAETLITEQGFLSAAEKASYDRLFAYVEGQLAP